MSLTKVSSFIFVALLAFNSAHAFEVKISKNMSRVKTAHDGKIVSIQRIQDTDHVLTGGYTKTSRKCPPFCIQPIQVAPGVTTVGELEVLMFIKNELNQGTGVLIDARTPSWFEKGTIPGSVNIPFTSFNKDKSDLIKTSALAKLGVTLKTSADEPSMFDYVMDMMGEKKTSVNSKWNFNKAKLIMLWCNGMWCGQSPRAIRSLLALGYPAEKIYYYRGGMQTWKILGLTTK
jgi:rhodanese-related sulfurtransferase